MVLSARVGRRGPYPSDLEGHRYVPAFSKVSVPANVSPSFSGFFKPRNMR